MRNLRVGWRLLLRQPFNSAVELLGLAAGFAVCFVLLAFVQHSFSYDHDVQQRDRVYIIKHRLNFIPQPQWMEYTPFALRGAALQSGLPLQVSAWWPTTATLHQNGEVREVNVTAVDPAFEQIAELRATHGDLQQALTMPDGLALTPQAALQLFGHVDAMGRTAVINGQTLQVRAMLPERPANSTMPFGLLVGVGSALWPDKVRQEALANWMGIEGRIYVKTDLPPQQLQAALQNVIDQAPWASMATPELKAALGGRKMVDIALGSLADAYFDRSVANTMGTGPRGDMRVVLALGAAGLLILLLAVVNYVNLATVRTVRRQREIAVRRVMGASTRELLAQFMTEAMMLSVAAAAAGLLLAWLLLPLASGLLQRQLEGALTPLSAAACLAFGALVGAAAGVYPGLLARGVDMRATLAQRSGDTVGGTWLRRAMTALQFSVAICMGSMALAMLWQTQFAVSASPGFDPTPLLVVEMPEDLNQPAARTLRDAIAQLPGVAGVADSRNVPGRDDNTGTRASDTIRRKDGSIVAMPIQLVGKDFFRVYDVKPLAGRTFEADGEESVVLNQAAVRALGWAGAQEAVGQRLNGSTLRVVGVVPELRWETLRAPAGPMMYQLSKDSRLLTVRLQGVSGAVGAGGASSGVAQAIAAAWQRSFPAHAPVIRHAAGYAALAYADEARLAALLACATAVVLMLASFGIYVLAAHSVQRRTREIVLRKLHGAGSAAIAALVGREFLLLTAVAALIALPPAWLAIARYLAPFAERSPLGPWAPLAALGCALLVAAAATARHTWAAMHIAPVQALRA